MYHTIQLDSRHLALIHTALALLQNNLQHHSLIAAATWQTTNATTEHAARRHALSQLQDLSATLQAQAKDHSHKHTVAPRNTQLSQ